MPEFIPKQQLYGEPKITPGEGVKQVRTARISGAIADRMELAKQLPILEAAVRKRNTLRLSEFQKFAPLYNVERFEKLTEEEVEYLAYELRSRVSLYDPIYVVSDQGDEDGKHEVLYTLPSILFSISTLSDTLKEGNRLLLMFVNAAGRDQPLSDRLPQLGAAMRIAFTKSMKKNSKQEEENMKRVLELEQKLKEQKTPQLETPPKEPIAGETDDFDWE